MHTRMYLRVHAEHVQWFILYCIYKINKQKRNKKCFHVHRLATVEPGIVIQVHYNVNNNNDLLKINRIV